MYIDERRSSTLTFLKAELRRATAIRTNAPPHAQPILYEYEKMVNDIVMGDCHEAGDSANTLDSYLEGEYHRLHAFDLADAIQGKPTRAQRYWTMRLLFAGVVL